MDVPFQGVTRFQHQLQRLFSFKGPHVLDTLESSVRANFPLADSNQPDFRLLREERLWGISAQLNITGVAGQVTYIQNPANSGVLIVITGVMAGIVNATAAAAQIIQFAIGQTQAVAGASTGPVFQRDSRSVAVTTQVRTITSGGTVLSSTVGVLGIIGTTVTNLGPYDLMSFMNRDSGIVLLPGTMIDFEVLLQGSTLTNGAGYINLSGFERHFEPSENYPLHSI